MRYVMVIDLRRCIGCYGCQIFCKSEKATPPGMLLSRVLFYESGTFPEVKKTPLPVLCMQCKEPACVDVCPTGAGVKRSDGIVTVESKKCTGCLNCVMACPYGARNLYQGNKEHFPGQGLTPYEEVGYQKHTTGVIEKCDFCLPRISKGLEPACVPNCMAQARFFGDLDDPESEVSQLLRDKKSFHVYPATYPGEEETTPEEETSVYYLVP
jgi:molybdopterin-containing oxidoreductase family iron-sulfur binding subunit